MTNYLTLARMHGFGGNTLRGAVRYLKTNAASIWSGVRHSGLALMESRWTSQQHILRQTAMLEVAYAQRHQWDASVMDAYAVRDLEEVRQGADMRPGSVPICEVDGLPLPHIQTGIAMPPTPGVVSPIERPQWSDPDPVTKYRATLAARTADPEAKRAKADAKYRALWLRRLGREQARLMAPPMDTLDQVTAAANSHEQRQSRVTAIARLRAIAGVKTPDQAVRKVTAGARVGGFDAKFARRHGVAGINMSGKDATIAPTRRSSYGVHSGGNTTWRNGRPVSYDRATHRNYVRSLALVRRDDPQTVDYVFHLTQVALTLPEGYVWDIDANGLRAVSGPDDYHPSAPELLCDHAVEVIVNRLVANRESRRLMAAQRAAEAAELEGVYVCVADSVHAGNCREGTRQFASRHALDTTRHYRATELLGIANGDASRVRLAIKAAVMRHRRELEVGYATLADHVA